MATRLSIPSEEAVRWLAREVLPHEADVRRWLAQSLVAASETDDVIQEAYCRLVDLDDPGRIRSPRAYFFQTARSIVLEQLRRQRVVRFETVTEIDGLNIEWDEATGHVLMTGPVEVERTGALALRKPGG